MNTKIFTTNTFKRYEILNITQIRNKSKSNALWLQSLYKF